MKKYVTARLTVVIGAVALVSMTLLFLVVNHHITKVLQEKAVADMNVIAGDRAELVETYIQGCCNFVDAYSRTSEAADALLHPKDDNAIRSAREITKSIAGNREGLEGLYIAQWDTYVLAHINPDSVDKTFREPDSAAVNLCRVARIRALGRKAGFTKVEERDGTVRLYTSEINASAVNRLGTAYPSLGVRVTSGMRFGSPAVTTRGMKEPEMRQIGRMIARLIDEGEAAVPEVKKQVVDLCETFPLYPEIG